MGKVFTVSAPRPIQSISCNVRDRRMEESAPPPADF